MRQDHARLASSGEQPNAFAGLRSCALRGHEQRVALDLLSSHSALAVALSGYIFFGSSVVLADKVG